MVSERLKNIIYKQLNKELSNVDIIPYKDRIYFIDRDKKYWYFEYDKRGKLWCRHSFFNTFFSLFSLEPYNYKEVIGEWVEEVLNRNVNTIHPSFRLHGTSVEEVLNYKVNTIHRDVSLQDTSVEEVLNHRLNTISDGI